MTVTTAGTEKLSARFTEVLVYVTDLHARQRRKLNRVVTEMERLAAQ